MPRASCDGPQFQLHRSGLVTELNWTYIRQERHHQRARRIDRPDWAQDSGIVMLQIGRSSGALKWNEKAGRTEEPALGLRP